MEDADQAADRSSTRANAWIVLFLSVALTGAMVVPGAFYVLAVTPTAGRAIGLILLAPGAVLILRSGVQAVTILATNNERRDPWFGVVGGSAIFGVAAMLWLVLSGIAKWW